MKSKGKNAKQTRFQNSENETQKPRTPVGKDGKTGFPSLTYEQSYSTC